MAIPWAGIGATLSGLGSIAGAFGGSKGTSMGKQVAYNWHNLWNEMSARVGGAKLAGIHPLYAIGQPSFSPSPVVAGQSRGQFGDALKAAGEVASGVGQRKRQAMMDAAALQESEARAYKSKAEGQLADWQAAALNQQIQAQRNAKASQNQNSARDKIYRSHVPVRDHFTGKVYYVPNPDVYELPEAIGGYEYGRGIGIGKTESYGPTDVQP